MAILQPKIQTYIRDTSGAETTSLPSPWRYYPSSTVLCAMRITMQEQPVTHPQLTSCVTARHCSFFALIRLPLGTPGNAISVGPNRLLFFHGKKNLTLNLCGNKFMCLRKKKSSTHLKFLNIFSCPVSFFLAGR